jgi:predicted transcriptional regulator
MHAKFYNVIGRYISSLYFGGREMRRRSRTEVIMDVLSEALGGANKTRIMYRANLNFLRFNRYFCELLDAGLVEVFDNPGSKSGGIVYRTTEKGRELLKVLQKANRFIEL